MPGGLSEQSRVEAARRVAEAAPRMRESFDRLARLAARALRAPVGQVNLVLPDRQVSLASVGPGDWARPGEVTLDFSLCRHVVESGNPLLVEDAIRHPLVAESRATRESGVVAYAAAPLAVTDDIVLGSLCVVDFEPRTWSVEDGEVLEGLARFVIEEIERRLLMQEDVVRLATLVESSFSPIFSAGLDGEIQTWNPAARRLFGYEHAEIVGRPLAALLPEGAEEAAERIVARVAAGESFRRNVRLRRRDGGQVEVSVGLSPLRDIGGRIRGIAAVGEDITERVEVRRALEESERRLRATFEQAAVGIAHVDPRGSIVRSNRRLCELVERTEEELRQERFVELFGANEAMTLEGGFREMRRGSIPFFRAEVRAPSPTPRWVLVTASLVREADGEDGYVIAVVEDVSDRRHAEEALRRSDQQLRQAQKMEAVGRLAGGIAHDFNNLLSVIRGSTDLALLDLPQGSSVRELLEQVNHAAARAAGLTGQLLAFSRQRVVQPEDLDLAEALSETRSMLERLIGEDITVEWEIPPGLVVRLDPVELSQVIMNLVVNARDAMPSGGRLAVRGEPFLVEDRRRVERPGSVTPGPYILLTVSDTGEGISEDVQARLFEPFFTTRESGTGLGLSTVYGIVSQAAGHIWVQSEEGRGATFKILLPAAGSRAPEAAAHRRDGLRTGDETVLLVEDDDAVRDTARRILERCGYRVIASPSGPDALSVAAGYVGRIHVLLSDVVMPEMGGPEVARRLLAMRPDTRVLFTSGYTGDAVLGGSTAVGDFAFLQKPYTPGELAEKVRRLLGE